LSWKSFEQATAEDHPVLQNSVWKGKYITSQEQREEEVRACIPSLKVRRLSVWEKRLEDA